MQALYSSGRELVVLFVAGKVRFYACSVIIFVQFNRVLFDASVTCFIQYLLTSCYCSLVCIYECAHSVRHCFAFSGNMQSFEWPSSCQTYKHTFQL